MDDGKISVLMLLDMLVAFDTTDHEIFLGWLQLYFGVHATALKWKRLYITERKQFVSVLEHDSEPIQLSFSIPQGSVLGPILFTMYTTSIQFDFQAFSQPTHICYTQLNTSANVCNIDSIMKSIQCCITGIPGWTIQNKLQLLNEGKTEALLVTTSCCDKELPVSIQIGSSIVPFIKNVRNLGVTLDSKLSTTKLVNKVCPIT